MSGEPEEESAMRSKRHSGWTWIMLFGIWAFASGALTAQVHPSADHKPWGPETPHFNLQVILRGEGFGLVRFRQPNDDAFIVHLDTWVRDLAPNTSYLLQRAVDVSVDDNCTGTAWLTLGRGLAPQSITTDATGKGREELFRSVAAFPVGSEFDIHFRVIEQVSGAIVLTSSCYQFTISQ
ncbi:MAG: hypothetical protein ABI610_13980 [Acidobacteriota bacterium]